ASGRSASRPWGVGNMLGRRATEAPPPRPPSEVKAVVHAVLFDVDGVLVHPWRFRAALARDHGITPEMTAPFFTGPFLDCIRGRPDVMDVLPPFLRSWGWGGSAADFVGAWLSVENAPNEAVLSVVADLRRCAVPCFVASTQERHRARYLATAMRFNQLFDGLF